MRSKKYIDEMCLCLDCRQLTFEKADYTCASECGCLTAYKNMTLCSRHAFFEKRCKACGVSLDDTEDAIQKRVDRIRRRRELKAAIKDREPFKEEEREQHERDRRNNGNTKKVRQRHRVSR